MELKNSNNSDFFYAQTKNGTETYLKYEKTHDGLDHYTETCGPTSIWNGCEAMGLDIKPRAGTGLRPADHVFEWLNTPANFWKLTDWEGCVAGQIPGNECQYWHSIAFKEIFNLNVVFHQNTSFDDVVAMLKQGHAVQLGRTIGHFICAVAYDETNDQLIYWDSFPLYINPDGSLTDDGTNGFRRTISRDWYTANITGNVNEIVGFIG